MVAYGCPMKRVLVPLAEGFEEIEAVTIVDVLRRAGLSVTVAGLEAGRSSVRGSHGIAVETDCELGSVDAGGFDMIVLPGGMPGTKHLMQDQRVLAAVRSLHEQGKTTAAVCAAPMVLAAAGIVSGVEVTSHPSVRQSLPGAVVVEDRRVVRSGRVITSQGPGTSLEFALALVGELVGEERALELAEAMIVSQAS
jgi:4-methyl-5(b-hydroxyethyl)-thiazole monophosphate biosynthesis